MLISTKGRYALRIMIDLAQNNNGSFVPLKDIARRQEISEKYLERIVSSLSKSKQVIGVRGKGGGYKLAHDPKNYLIGDILRLADGSLAPVACLEEEWNSCSRSCDCKTLPMWTKLDQLIAAYFDAIRLSDLVSGDLPDCIANALDALKSDG